MPLKLRGDGVQLLRGVTLAREGLADAPLRERLKATKLVFEPVAAALTGAEPRDCFALPPLFRSDTPEKVRESGVEDTSRHSSGSRPHDVVHNDYDDGFRDFLLEAEPERLREFLCVSSRDPRFDSARTLADRVRAAERVVVVQFWGSYQRPGTVIEQHPLAVCLPRSVAHQGLASLPLPEYDGVVVGGKFNVTLAVHSPAAAAHEWVYFSSLARDETMTWIGYDSKAKPMRPPLHSAFWLPDPGKTRAPRESFECRVVCLLDGADGDFLPAQGPRVAL